MRSSKVCRKRGESCWNRNRYSKGVGRAGGKKGRRFPERRDPHAGREVSVYRGIRPIPLSAHEPIFFIKFIVNETRLVTFFMNRSKRDCRIRNGGRGPSIGAARRESAGNGRARTCPHRLPHCLLRFAQSGRRGRCNPGSFPARAPLWEKDRPDSRPESLAREDCVARGGSTAQEHD